VKVVLFNAGLVGLGGFVGALGRYVLSGVVHRLFSFGTFPSGTLAVNFMGCFAIGLFAGLAESRQAIGPEFRFFALIGVLGGFTTFSTFGYETFLMIRDSEYLRAATNVGASVVIGLALVWLGYAITAGR
jgi:CrcB protein